jgi:uncharacterized iron-regulated membrane protein
MVEHVVPQRSMWLAGLGFMARRYVMKQQASTADMRGFQGGFRQSMSWLHTWIGLLLAVVLYFMFITGTVGYFYHEVDRWMMPERVAADTRVPQRQMIERAVERLSAVAPNAKDWYVSLPYGRQSQLEIWYQPQPDANGKEIEGVNEFLDARTGQPQPKVRDSGGGAALYAMHYALHYIPYEVAIYIVGVATMFMLIALITGIVVHKKIFKDFFTFRPAKGQRSWLDAHNISSVMALPFMVMITYSGLVFYTYEYMPSVRTALYGNSEQAVKKFESEIYGDEHSSPTPASQPAPLAPFAAMLDAVQQQWGPDGVKSFSVYLPGDANAMLRFDRQRLSGLGHKDEHLLFNGVTGQAHLHEDKPMLAANTFYTVMIALHEGRFAGPVLRWLYFITGLLGAAMVATGAVLWVAKRRQQLKRNDQPELGLRVVERLNVGVIAGLLVGIAAYFWANRLLPLNMADRAAWEMHVLFITWAACLAHGLLRMPARGWVEQFGAAALLYGLIPLLNWFTTNQHLGTSLPAGDWVMASFDLTACVLGVIFAVVARRLQRRQQSSPRLLEPAGADTSNDASTSNSPPQVTA